MADSCVEGGGGGGGTEKPTMTTTDKSKNTATTPGFKLFGTRIVTVREPTSQLQRNQPTSKSESTSASANKPQLTNGNDHAPGTPQTAASGLACPRCKSRETKFCYFNNYNVNQPRHFCRGCHRYWTAGGALRNVPVGAGRRKAGAASAATSTRSPGIDGNGANDFGMSNGLMMDGVVVQQWLMSHDGGFPSKRPNITSFNDRTVDQRR